MIIMGGMAAMAVARHDWHTSEGPDDPQTVSPPPDATGVLFSVEDASVRVTFDGSLPTRGNGLLPRGRRARASAQGGHHLRRRRRYAASVSFVWLKSTVSTRQMSE